MNMKRLHATSAVVFGIFFFGFVNCFDFFDGFPRRTPITHELFDVNPAQSAFWPLTHKSLFPISRRVADDDSSEEVLVEPSSGPLGIDSISGSIGHPDDVEAEIGNPHDPNPFNTFDPTGIFFHQTFNPFVNHFNPFNGMAPRQQLWWRGMLDSTTTFCTSNVSHNPASSLTKFTTEINESYGAAG